MRELLDRIEVRFPAVARRWRKFAARWLADEAALLEPNHVLLRGRDDILPGLAQAIRECGVELSEMARACGRGAKDLRVAVALSRLGELLNPGEIWNLSDQKLDSKLRQAAREYDLQADELLEEICHLPNTSPPSLPAKRTNETFSLGRRLRCWACSALRPRCYKIDFTRNAWQEPGAQPGPAYACARCLPAYLTFARVRQITRLDPVEAPNSPGLRIRFAALAVLVILACSALYARAKGTMQQASGPRARVASASARAAPGAIAASGRAAAAKARSEGGDSTRRSGTVAAAAAADSSQPPSAFFSTQVVPDSTIVPQSLTAANARASDPATDDGRQSAPHARSVEPAQEIAQRSGSQPSLDGNTLDHCRQILHSERPLMRYSVRDTMKEADRSALAPSDACARRLDGLKDLGNACADSFRWFEAFQTTLLNRVKRVCREAAHKRMETETLTTGSKS